MFDQQTESPDSTAVRVALWRAMHVEVDAPPHVFHDKLGLRLAAPGEHWRSRPDMNPQWSRGMRASIVARARFIEDLITKKAGEGISQYVLLGSGLDTFAQRRPEIACRLRVFEVDRPDHLAWKRRRLIDLGYGVPEWLRLVPVDFEAGVSWWQRLSAEGFDASKPSVVASTGVSMYLTKEANVATLRQLTALAAGSTFAMTFMLPLELVEPDGRRLTAMAMKKPAFISFFAPTDMLTLAREAGFKDAEHVSAAMLTRRYFGGRTDGFRPLNREELLVAST
ncbi:MAG: SAM-dependent methyltransferase [Proteobacteria bacterium]|nr:MAG: SAM-dependent methyltransferase [Pseudomonadota bacterium]